MDEARHSSKHPNDRSGDGRKPDNRQTEASAWMMSGDLGKCMSSGMLGISNGPIASDARIVGGVVGWNISVGIIVLRRGFVVVANHIVVADLRAAL